MKKLLVLLAFSVFVAGCSKSKADIVGVWIDDSETYTFSADHSLELTYSQGNLKGKWEIVKDNLILTWDDKPVETHIIVKLDKDLILKRNGMDECTWIRK